MDDIKDVIKEFDDYENYNYRIGAMASVINDLRRKLKLIELEKNFEIMQLNHELKQANMLLDNIKKITNERVIITKDNEYSVDNIHIFIHSLKLCYNWRNHQ